MRILLSNDDGILAPGILTLAEVCHRAGHQVMVAAPDRQRSAAGHSMTILPTLRARRVDLPGTLGAFAVEGTPVDCVKLGLSVLFPETDLVISGVNEGYNSGMDVLYSGTVAAALEGAMMGKPAIAISTGVEAEGGPPYLQAAKLAVSAIRWLEQMPLPPMSMLNLNYPGTVCRGFRFARRLYPGSYVNNYTREGEPEGDLYTFHLDGYKPRPKKMPDTDDFLLSEGYATGTILSYDMTDHDRTIAMESKIAAVIPK